MISLETKPTVHYNVDGVKHIIVGQGATVNVLDHYSEWLCSGQMVLTSIVLSYDGNTGIFETKNSIYVPMKLEGEQQ